MALTYHLLYRGPLKSCNYTCVYCPFAKKPLVEGSLAEDREALKRFVQWIGGRKNDRISIFFTPWGEALIHSHYRQAAAYLSRLSHVEKVVFQTNLSCGLDWLLQCDPARTGLWCTWHPSQIALEPFMQKCLRLSELRINYSVGMVGVKENKGAALEMRRSLPENVYLWVNAVKDVPDYYNEEDIGFFAAIDSNFQWNLHFHPSLGRLCRTGRTAFSIDGAGNVNRCHFTNSILGNIHENDLESLVTTAPCPNETCGCHIGYVYLEYLEMDRLFGPGLLERALDPVQWSASASPRKPYADGWSWPNRGWTCTPALTTRLWPPNI